MHENFRLRFCHLCIYIVAKPRLRSQHFLLYHSSSLLDCGLYKINSKGFSRENKIQCITWYYGISTIVMNNFMVFIEKGDYKSTLSLSLLFAGPTQ